jgi:hypothetical protein
VFFHDYSLPAVLDNKRAKVKSTAPLPTTAFRSILRAFLRRTLLRLAVQPLAQATLGLNLPLPPLRQELNVSLGSPMAESAFFLRSRRLFGYSISDQAAFDVAVAAAPFSAAALVSSTLSCRTNVFLIRSPPARPFHLPLYLLKLFLLGCACVFHFAL